MTGRTEPSNGSALDVLSDARTAGDAAGELTQCGAFSPNACDLVLEVDRAATVVAANRWIEPLTGKSPAQLEGQTYWSLFEPREERAQRELFDRVLRGEVVETETSLPTKGAARCFSVLLLPIEANDEVVGAHVVLRDVTRYRDLQAQLIQSEKLASVGQIAAGVAHEINNPLAYVLSNLTLLREHARTLRGFVAELRAAGTPTEQTNIEAAVARHRVDELLTDLAAIATDSLDGAERIRRISRDLRSLARVDEDDVELVDVNAILNGTLNVVFNEIRHRARLEKHLADLPRIATSPGRLSQVFLNLLVNAAQAIDDGHADHNVITVRTELDGGRIRVAISDTGPGIPEEIRDRIFEPFFTTKPKGVGTGLGLAICREIVASYRGDIQAEARSGGGTTFVVALPLDTGRTPRKSRPAPSVHAAAGRRARVLIVDDDLLILKAYQRMVEHAHEVRTASGGKEALRLLVAEREHFDVVVCDLMMPDIGGAELYGTIRDRRPELASRFVFVTGGAFTPGAKEFLERVPNLWVEKPFDAGQLLAMIAQLAGPERGRR
ncbi:MAG: response regulator [Myxococcales bacterium]|nr:response regulator [Myxococcales bacterium]